MNNRDRIVHLQSRSIHFSRLLFLRRVVRLISIVIDHGDSIDSNSGSFGLCLDSRIKFEHVLFLRLFGLCGRFGLLDFDVVRLDHFDVLLYYQRFSVRVNNRNFDSSWLLQQLVATCRLSAYRTVALIIAAVPAGRLDRHLGCRIGKQALRRLHTRVLRRPFNYAEAWHRLGAVDLGHLVCLVGREHAIGHIAVSVYN